MSSARVPLLYEDKVSDYKVPYTTILEINNHPNADRLELATVYGFQVVIQKNSYSVGDRVIYIPVDSILPQELEDKLFPPDSKIKLEKHRVRQIRIRGFPSQGMIIDADFVQNIESYALETDLSNILGIEKYEQPQVFINNRAKSSRDKRSGNTLFHKYNGVENIKWYPNLFKSDEWVCVQEKLHGTNCRAGILPRKVDRWWKKILVKLGFLSKYQKCYGSNNVDISAHGYTAAFAYYDYDVYKHALDKAGIFDKLKPGEIIYGEVIGKGIQNGYDYGHDDPTFVAFDMKKLKDDGTFEWLDPIRVSYLCSKLGIAFVPVLHIGPFDKERIATLSVGSSTYNDKEVIEGVVIKAVDSYDNFGNKRALKLINTEYLDNKFNTDFH